MANVAEALAPAAADDDPLVVPLALLFAPNRGVLVAITLLAGGVGTASDDASTDRVPVAVEFVAEDEPQLPGAAWLRAPAVIASPPTRPTLVLDDERAVPEDVATLVTVPSVFVGLTLAVLR